MGGTGRQRLAPLLELLVRAVDPAVRVRADPVEFPRRCAHPRDQEVSGLLSACLAYGRVDLFKAKLERLHAWMGPEPARFLRELPLEEAARELGGFTYRFNVGADLAVLLLGMGQALREHGTLEALFLRGLGDAGGALRPALRAFSLALQAVPREPLERRLGPVRGLHHLLPSAASGGAYKRLNLYLRWMVRGPDAVDLGAWRNVSPAALVIPLDTHIARMARQLGLTRRRDLGWRTAEEITSALREVDPADPTRFDFALCHFGMSGACPLRPATATCAACPLLPGCGPGQRRVRRGARGGALTPRAG
jgi:uncharacterized protein (TIGR02757 family)